MNIASWIAIYIAVLFACGAGRKKNRVCGSFIGNFLTVAAIVAGCIFFLRVAQNRSPLAHITLPTIHIPSIRIATNATHITTRPGAKLTAPAIPPTTQISNLWIEDWSEFINTTHWKGFRAESSDTCVTEAEARQQAIDNAATTLSQMAVADPSFTADARSRDAILPSLKSEIASHLQSGEFIADQVVRKVEKSYGTLYKSYLLIDAPNSTLGTLSQFARDALSQSKTNEMTTWASMAGLFLVIILLYAFLNAATKGYYAGRLRAAMILGIIVGILGVLAWYQ